MTNYRLRGAMLNAELTVPALARIAGVDPKSVWRWLDEDRVPHPITRHRVARALDQQETFLWPQLLDAPSASGIAAAELERIWLTRSAIPTQTWLSLFSRGSKQLDILVYTGTFLIETIDLVDVIKWKCGAGAHVRILIGDPHSEAVKIRARELDFPLLPDHCRLAQRHLAAIGEVRHFLLRAHATTLYASMFRFDDVMLVNQHAFGAFSHQSPVHQVACVQDGYLFGHYAAAFERVWHLACATTPADG